MKQKLPYAKSWGIILPLSLVKQLFKHLIVLSSIIVAACSSTPKPSLTMQSVSLYTQPDTNQNSALAVDLVIVYGSELMGTLNQMSAKTYFAASKQLLLDNPTLLEIWHWELVPGQRVIGFQPPQNKGDAFGAYVFADYFTPGDHRLRVTPDGIVSVLFMKDDLKNLSAMSANDMQLGATMTTPSCWGDSSGQSLKQGSTTGAQNAGQASIMLGPVTNVVQPCKQVVPQPCQSSSQPCQGSSAKVGGVRRQGPLPIVAQSLPPLKKKISSPCSPCNSKRNKVN